MSVERDFLQRPNSQFNAQFAVYRLITQCSGIYEGVQNVTQADPARKQLLET
ncbi:MAG: hypothetical protein P1U77_11900 [Rubripirellula sp.]|nr:hypothetical protein [Planctomycetaceae bacterium]MDF1842130.1 hypothetical protein [Rubripirellula sp.]